MGYYCAGLIAGSTKYLQIKKKYHLNDSSKIVIWRPTLVTSSIVNPSRIKAPIKSVENVAIVAKNAIHSNSLLAGPNESGESLCSRTSESILMVVMEFITL